MTIVKKIFDSIKSSFVLPENEKEVAKQKLENFHSHVSSAINSHNATENIPFSILTEETKTEIAKHAQKVAAEAWLSDKPVVVPPNKEADETKSVILFKNVSKKFGEKVVLDNVNFSIRDYERKGRIVTIVGQSGCGKSTLLRMIAGLKPHWPPTQGEIFIDGNISGLPSIVRGLVDQKYCLLPHLKIWENIAFGMQLKGIPLAERKDIAMNWIQKVNLDGNENKYPSALSGGMQQRAAIASTLCMGPQIILMDEPFGALDPKTRLRMQELLISLWAEQRSTIVLVTHSIEEAVYLGDRIFRMGANPGRIIEELNVPRPSEPPEVFRTKPWFTELVFDLRSRLETDAEALGELGSKAKKEASS
jgi:NitT/TauT family transport system ATP-binding protein